MITKECVGCGVIFIVEKEVSDNMLYCSTICEENHSIFDFDMEWGKDNENK